MIDRQKPRRPVSSGSVPLLVVSAVALSPGQAVLAEEVTFEIPAQSAASALRLFGQQVGKNLLFSQAAVEGVLTRDVVGEYESEDALQILLRGTGLWAIEQDGVIAVKRFDEKRSSDVERISGRADASQRFRMARADAASTGGALATSGRSDHDRADENDTSDGLRRGGAAVLEEVTVTAERRAENSQDVPISMSVFSGDFIKQHISDPFDVANFTPNYQISRPSEGLTTATVVIRGLGSSDQANPIAATSYLVYYDGVASGTPFASAIPQWDLDRIEVQRGPQGTLYGRNAAAGAIQYFSAMPTDELEGYGEVTIGEFDLRRFEGAISGPITDNVQARFSGMSYDRGGDMTNPFLGAQLGEREWWGVRGIVDWQIAPDFDARVKVQHFAGEAESFFFNAAPSNLLSPDQLAFFDAIGYDADLSRESNFERMQSGLLEPSNSADIDLVELDLNHDFGPVALTVIGGYLGGDTRANNSAVDYPVPINDQLVLASLRQWSGEVRLTSQTDHPLQWIAGAYYQRTNDTFDADIDLTALLRDLDGDGLTRYNADSPEDLLDGLVPSIPASTIFFEGGNEQELRTHAVFLHTTFDWTDRFTTTHAARYTHEEKAMEYRFVSFLEFPVSAGVTPGTLAQHYDFVQFARLSPAQQRRSAVSIIADPNGVDANGNVVPRFERDSWNEVTWRFAADYRLTDDALLYASISKGFRGGIFAVLTDPTNAVSADPEKSFVYEIGAKTQWFNDRLQINASVFYDEHHDFQTTLFVTDLVGGVFNLVTNLPESKLRGGEIEMRAVPFDNFLVVAGLGLLDTEITKTKPGNEALLGNELPGAEDMNFSGLLRYDIRTALGTFSPQLSWRYRGEAWSSKNNEDITGEVGNFWTADVWLGYERVDSKLYAQFYARNVFDEVQAIQNADPLASYGSTTSGINERRNWGVTVGYRF